MVRADAVTAIKRQMAAELKQRGVQVLDVYVCPHHWNDVCDSRKSAPGMLFRASRERLLRLDRTFYIGDDPRDCVAAFNAKCPSILVGPERGVDPGEGARPDRKVATLPEVVPWIASRSEAWEAQC